MKLKGKIALVTGASTGIGKEVCFTYASEGAKVVVNYIGDPILAEQVVNRIQADGGEALAIHADVSQEKQVVAMVDQVAEQWGGVDILVNNAGIYPRKTWYEITEEEWDQVMAVNLKSCFFTCKAVFPHMRQQQYGKIINVSSVTFLRGQANFLHYVSSKGGVVGFTRALAREVGKEGITVNVIAPGAVLTEQEIINIGPNPEPTLEASRVYFEKEQCLPRRQLPP